MTVPSRGRNAWQEFVANVSHELRTPLTLIIHPIEEVIKQNNLSIKSYEYLTVARKNTNRMVRFINQLLDFQKSTEWQNGTENS